MTAKELIWGGRSIRELVESLAEAVVFTAARAAGGGAVVVRVLRVVDVDAAPATGDGLGLDLKIWIRGGTAVPLRVEASAGPGVDAFLALAGGDAWVAAYVNPARRLGRFVLEADAGRWWLADFAYGAPDDRGQGQFSPVR